MRKIEYTFTTVARQFMFISCFIYVLLHFAVFCQIEIYKIEKYYNAFNVPLTIAVYSLIFIFLITLFFQHRFFFLEYDREVLTYGNRLLRNRKSVAFNAIETVICDKFGAYFYSKGTKSREKKDCAFYLPFFRGGRIDVVQLDKLLKYMETQEISVTKTYTVMPGYGGIARVLTFLYGFIAICFIGNCSKALYTVIVLFSSH